MEKRTTEYKGAVAIVGVESSGKTTLACQLADHYDEPLSEEFAREYLKINAREYDYHDLNIIAKGQLQNEVTAESEAQELVICDTSLLVIIVWSLFKFGKCDPEIERMYLNRNYCTIFLTDYDIPWEYDELRENPSIEERKTIHELYKRTLEKFSQPFHILRGSEEERLRSAIRIINSL